MDSRRVNSIILSNRAVMNHQISIMDDVKRPKVNKSALFEAIRTIEIAGWIRFPHAHCHTGHPPTNAPTHALSAVLYFEVFWPIHSGQCRASMTKTGAERHRARPAPWAETCPRLGQQPHGRVKNMFNPCFDIMSNHRACAFCANRHHRVPIHQSRRNKPRAV